MFRQVRTPSQKVVAPNAPQRWFVLFHFESSIFKMAPFVQLRAHKGSTNSACSVRLCTVTWQIIPAKMEFLFLLYVKLNSISSWASLFPVFFPFYVHFHSRTKPSGHGVLMPIKGFNQVALPQAKVRLERVKFNVASAAGMWARVSCGLV